MKPPAAPSILWPLAAVLLTSLIAVGWLLLLFKPVNVRSADAEPAAMARP